MLCFFFHIVVNFSLIAVNSDLPKCGSTWECVIFVCCEMFYFLIFCDLSKGEETVKGSSLCLYSVKSSQQGCLQFIMRNSISDFPIFHIYFNVAHTIPTYYATLFYFDMEIIFWSMDCMKSVIPWRQNPVDVAVDAAKTVTLMWLNARIGTVNYPAYVCHTQ